MSARSLLTAESLQRSGDADHLLRAERLGQRVGHPVDRLAGPPGDEPDALAVAEDHELAPVADDRVVRVVENRRLPPRGALDAVVLADDALREHEPVGVVLTAPLVANRVRPRLGALVGGVAG